MAEKRILIVDDHKEAARLLRAHLETLDHRLLMDDVFSGEEALLEIGRGQVDLLVADVRLPGISGIELMRKFKARRSDARVILISGVTDPKIRQEVAQAGADAFFFKPIDIPDFLDAVERSLGLVDTILQPELHLHAQELEEENNNQTRVAEQIAELHRTLNATAVLLVGNDGKVLFRNGSLPDPQLETALMPNLMTTFHAGVKISHFLGQNRPDHFYSFRGENYDLFITPAGESYCLLALTRPILLSELSDVAIKMDAAAKLVVLSLARMGISAQSENSEIENSLPPVESSTPVEESPAPEPLQKPEPEPPAPINEIPADASLEDLFASAGKIDSQDADAFWESFSAEEIKPELSSGSSLSYDQAAQLGLAPQDE